MVNDISKDSLYPTLENHGWRQDLHVMRETLTRLKFTSIKYYWFVALVRIQVSISKRYCIETKKLHESHQKAENIVKFIGEILEKEVEVVTSNLKTLEAVVENHPTVKTSIYAKKGQKEMLAILKKEINQKE